MALDPSNSSNLEQLALKGLNFASLSCPTVHLTIIRPSITCNAASIALLLSFYYMFYVVLDIRPVVVIFNCFIVIIQPLAAL